MRQRVDLDLQVGKGGEQLRAHGVADFPVGTNEEDGFDSVKSRQVDQLVVNRCSSHGIARPHTDTLILEVRVSLDHIRDELPTIVDLLHFVQVTKPVALGAVRLVLRLDKLDNVSVYQ